MSGRFVAFFPASASFLRTRMKIGYVLFPLPLGMAIMFMGAVLITFAFRRRVSVSFWGVRRMVSGK